MHRLTKPRGRFGVVVVAAVIACQMAAPTVAWAHGGGGGHGGGGFGGGGGRAMGGGGFGGLGGDEVNHRVDHAVHERHRGGRLGHRTAIGEVRSIHHHHDLGGQRDHGETAEEESTPQGGRRGAGCV